MGLWTLRLLGLLPWRTVLGRAEATPSEEEELVRRAQRGDSDAIAQIYEENVAKVFRFIAFRVGDRVEAEDLTHDVFLRVVQSIDSFQWRGTSLKAWIFRIAHNLVVDHLRQRSRRPTTPLDDEFPLPAPDDPAAEAELRSTMSQVLRAMRHLTEAQRQAITLRFASELSVEEVAQAMGKKPGAIKALQHSGLASLRRILARDEKRRNEG